MEKVCYACKHRFPKRVCGFPQSPFYQQQIELEETICDYFEYNPARDHYTQALAKHLQLHPDNDLPSDEISSLILEGNQEFEKAIQLGLPEDDEVQVRSFLANRYIMFAKNQYDQADIHCSEMQEALRQIEKAVELDVKGAYGYFADALNLKRLQDYDLWYSMQFRAIKEEQGIDRAVHYAEDKLRLYNQLPTNPLLNLLLDVGNAYGRKGDHQHAKQYFQQIVNTTQISSGDGEMEGWEADVREKARGNLRVTEEQFKEKSGGCYIATACYGSYDAAEVQVLRRFRDEKLSQSWFGRLFIRCYYRHAPALAAMLQGRTTINAFIRTQVLDKIVSIILH